MVFRVLLGAVAALRSVLVPGQAEVLLSQPLSWPKAARPLDGYDEPARSQAHLAHAAA